MLRSAAISEHLTVFRPLCIFGFTTTEIEGSTTSDFERERIFLDRKNAYGDRNFGTSAQNGKTNANDVCIQHSTMIENTNMRIFLTGVSCVGKTTIGEKLANLLNCPFFDLDREIENFFGTSIGKLRNKFSTAGSFQVEASKALKKIVSNRENFVMALPPSGLTGSYWKIVEKSSGTIVVLRDRPENIVKRIVFFDIDSKPIEKKLSAKERKLYLGEIEKDIAYFNPSHERAHLSVDLDGAGVDESARAIMKAIFGPVEKLEFKIGQSVKVKEGTLCPDNEKYDIGGWQGRIFETDDEDETLVGINWDGVTLSQMPEEYIIESEKEHLDWASMYLDFDDLEPADSRDSEDDTDGVRATLEGRYSCFSLGPEGETIHAVIKTAESDDDWDILKAWNDFMEKNLVFPFEAVVDEFNKGGPLKQGEKVKVSDFQMIDDDYGIIVSCRKGRRKHSFSLADLDAVGKNKKYVDAYRTWFANK